MDLADTSAMHSSFFATTITERPQSYPTFDAAYSTSDDLFGSRMSRKLRSDAEVTIALGELEGQPTVLLFGARSCRTCRLTQPKLERLAWQSGARFLYVHHGVETREAFAEHAVTATPTIEVYDSEGDLVDRGVYSTAAADLQRFASVLEEVALRA